MSAPVTFLDGRVTLYPGDCREVMAGLPDASVDSVVTDPPYHLTSIVKRFGADNAAPCKEYPGYEHKGRGGNPYQRTSTGFMGQKWDGGDIAFDSEFWADVVRVLKPGGHIVSFGGTRTYHRMVCAIEDAGFEIRDQIGWVFGSGFPKSHDVSKGIDKAGGNPFAWRAFSQAYARAVADSSLTHADIDRVLGIKSSSCYWARSDHRGGMPPRHHWANVRELLSLSADFERLYNEAEREVTSRNNRPAGWFTSGDGHDITAPATEEAARWQGWGTALKPAWESICLARKPLIGTVAENVLAHGTGAINIDACRVTADGGRPLREHTGRNGNIYGAGLEGSRAVGETSLGRWPANLVHDGSEEVLAAFPETTSGKPTIGEQPTTETIYGQFTQRSTVGGGDTGSAARFFASFPLDGQRFHYSSKADADDRIGSRHPTVKPVDLMRWLCRLVTPPNGTILDPFAGTGTTGEAAFYEGFNAILIEREAEYIADIERRMRLVMAGPDERARESIKARQSGKPVDNGPLFAWQTGF